MKLKEEIRRQIIENEEMELKGLKDMYATHTDASDIDEETSLGYEDFAKQDESRESANQLRIRINQAQEALDNFVSLSFGAKTEVGPGSLVLTDSLNFYIGISATMFNYENKTYIGLDVDAPIYSELNEAKAGDEITFKDQKYKILEVL